MRLNGKDLFMLDIRRRVVALFAAGFLMLAAVFGLIGEGTTAMGLFQDSTQRVLADVRSPVHICHTCGAPHGGVYHPNYCHNCVSKGLTPVKPS